MNLYFKFFALLIKRLLFKNRLSIHDTSRTCFRVTPSDLDLNFHMNNGRYFSVMDLGRFDLLLSTGHFYPLFRKGYYPVVLSEAILFKRSLGLFQKYEVHTRVDSWDKKFFYMTQKFFYKEQLIASANVRACFKKRGQKGIVAPKSLFEEMGETFEPRELSKLAEQQIALDEELFPRNR